MAHSDLAAPLVSVIVRTTGRPTLGRSLRAIAWQEYPNIETVVVDAIGAGNLDTCDGRAVRIVGNDRPLPRADAANLGLLSARGEGIVLLDDDDEFEPAHIGSLVAALANSPCLAAYSDAEATDTKGRVVQVYARDYSPTLLHTVNLFPIHTVLFSRRLIEQGCRFDPSLPALSDWDFWLQVAEHTSFVRVPHRTARYNIEVGTSGSGKGTNRNAAAVDAAARMIDARWRVRRSVLEREHLLRRARAFQLVHSSRLTEAEPILADLVEIDPRDVDALALLAYCAFRAGRWDNAASALERATALRSDRFDLQYNLALAHERAGRPAIALAALRLSLASKSDFAPAQGARARLEGDLL